jgi:hypothetical protein
LGFLKRPVPLWWRWVDQKALQLVQLFLVAQELQVLLPQVLA